MVSIITILSLAISASSMPTWPFNVPEYQVDSCSSVMLNPFFPYSCENNSAIIEQESCCFETYGIILQAQFWDYDPKKLQTAINGTSQLKAEIDSNNGYFQGKGFFGIGDWLKDIWQQFHLDKSSDMPIEKAFTIHGLWDDRCDGTWDEYCQPQLEVSNDKDNITDIIVNQFNDPELFELMSKYWINTLNSNVADDSSIELWEHEYNKHGTCMNTIMPKCFTGDYQQWQSPVEFWKKTTKIWDDLNSYEFLSRQGIIPTVKSTYKKSDIETALSNSHNGKQIYIGCTDDGALDEVWYYYLVKGNVLTGDYKPIDSTGSSSCPENIWYIPK